MIASLRVPEVSLGVGTSVGSNLDGMDSGEGSLELDANCEEFNTDYVSPDGRRGIDNAYGGLVGTLESLLDSTLEEYIARSIVSGELLLVLDVGGSPPSEVVVWLAAPLDPLDSTDGRLDPGNVVLGLMAVGRGRARSDGPLVTARIDDWNAPLPPELAPFVPLGTLRDVELHFVLASGGITRGQLGAWFTIEDSIEAGGPFFTAGIEDTVRSVMESVADINPGPVDPAICEGLSIGMAFEAVPVVLER